MVMSLLEFLYKSKILQDSPRRSTRVPTSVGTTYRKFLYRNRFLGSYFVFWQ